MIFVTSALLISIPTVVCIFLLWDLHAIVVIVIALITVFTVITTGTAVLSLVLSLSAILIKSMYTNQDDRMSKPGCISETLSHSEECNEKVDGLDNLSHTPPGVRYCSECQVQIKNIDHFCPWTGTTIGANNFPCFKIFTSSLCLLIILVIVFSLLLFQINKILSKS